jgi:hypothetical protein
MVMKMMVVEGFYWLGYAAIAKRMKCFHEWFIARCAKFGIGAAERIVRSPGRIGR